VAGGFPQDGLARAVRVGLTSILLTEWPGRRNVGRTVTVRSDSVSSGQGSAPDSAGPGLSVDCGCGDSEITGVRLSSHPWVDNGFPSLGEHGLVANSGLLDAFAREFANNPRLTNRGEIRRSDPEMQDFFLIWLPNRLFNIAAGLEVAPENYRLDMSTAQGMGSAQWLAHLGGYYAAVWLRACWTNFDGKRTRDFPMRDSKFHAIYKRQLDTAILRASLRGVVRSDRV